MIDSATGFLENIAFILALGFLYDLAYRIHKERPSLPQGVLVGLAFSVIVFISQFSPVLAVGDNRWTIGFIIIFYATLVGSGAGAIIAVGMVLLVTVLELSGPVSVRLYAIYGAIWVFAWGLKRFYKPYLTQYSLIEMLAIYFVVMNIFSLPALFFPVGMTPLPQENGLLILGLGIVMLCVIFMLAGIVLRRAINLHQTQEAYTRQMQHQAVLANVISDIVVQLTFDAKGMAQTVTQVLGDAQTTLYMPRLPDGALDLEGIVAKEDVPRVREAVTTLLAGEPIMLEVPIAVDDGQRRVWYRVYGMPIKRPNRALVTEAVFALKNIDAEKQTQAEQQAIRLERERVQILQTFMLKADHQFRTPLSSIHTNLYLLRKVQDSERRTRYLDVIEQQANLLLQLVEALTLLTQLETREEITGYAIDINQTIQAILPTYRERLLAEGNAILLNADLAPDLPKLRGHYEFIKYALKHLIDNGIRYTQQGSVTITTHAESEGDRRYLVIRVADTGIGMSEAVMQRAFERFYRADIAQQSPGWGLGLPFVKEVANHYRGRVTLQSTEGVGTTATLYLQAE